METVLITGASSGIGKDLAEIFAGKKYNLILVARNKDVLHQMAIDYEQRFSIKINYFEMDLSTHNSATRLYNSVKDLGKNIDILINNAGIGMYGEGSEMEAEKVSAMLDLNINSLTELTLLFAHDMKQKHKGKILNVASTAAFQPVPYMAAYAASKAYVLSFSEALHIELKKYGVTVSVLCPGATATHFAKTAKAESSKLFQYGVMESKEVAEKAYEGIIKNKTIIITGRLNAFLSRSVSFLPRKWAAIVAGKMMK